MASSSVSVVYPTPPLPNKRDQGTIGADLTVTYHSDLAQCEILPTGSRYTSAGNFKAGTFLPFIQPAFIHDLYPRLLSPFDDETSGLPLILSMFNPDARTANLEEDWEGKWFTIVARLFPNKLTFHGVRLDGWDAEEARSVQVSLALPRDGGLTPVIPRQLRGSDETVPWPSSPTHVSLAGPVDLDTFHIKDGVWPDPLTKTSVFVRLGSYLQPENDRPPHKGVHVCHVLVIFPVEQQPWRSLLGWMRTATNPFPRGSWMVCSGRLLGVLDRDLIQGPRLVDPTVRILVILPDNWEFVRQNALATNNTPTPTSSNAVTTLPTTPRPTGPGGVTSRNPFSSPSSGRRLPPQKNALPPTPTGPGASLNTTTTNHDPVPTIPSSYSDCTNGDSDTEQLLEDQLASSRRNAARKKKASTSPEPIRSKRSTAGKKKARLYD